MGFNPEETGYIAIILAVIGCPVLAFIVHLASNFDQCSEEESDRVKRIAYWIFFVVALILALFGAASLYVYKNVPEQITTIGSDVQTEVIAEIEPVSMGEYEDGELMRVCAILDNCVYLYYYKTENGSYRQDSVSSDAEIVFSNDKPEVVKVTTTTRTEHFWWGFYRYTEETVDSRLELRIPKGSLLSKPN